jgi:hypothetical protein
MLNWHQIRFDSIPTIVRKWRSDARHMNWSRVHHLGITFPGTDHWVGCQDFLGVHTEKSAGNCRAEWPQCQSLHVSHFLYKWFEVSFPWMGCWSNRRVTSQILFALVRSNLPKLAANFNRTFLSRCIFSLPAAAYVMRNEMKRDVMLCWDSTLQWILHQETLGMTGLESSIKVSLVNQEFEEEWYNPCLSLLLIFLAEKSCRSDSSSNLEPAPMATLPRAEHWIPVYNPWWREASKVRCILYIQRLPQCSSTRLLLAL